jgi:hypothetical protein
MQVYVIPMGRDRYELYCERTAAPAPEPAEASGGWLSRLGRYFAYMVHEAEAQEGAAPDPTDRTWWARLQTRLRGWVAERVAEQRLLWNLRHETTVLLVHPGDMTRDQTVTLVNRMLRRDHDRHRLWLAVNGVLLLLSAVLAVVPGPNFVAYYFAFRVVGHFLSMRGAAQGLHRITWDSEASDRLADVRQAVLLEPGQRSAAVHAIGADLGLVSLGAFVDRLAVR